MPLLCIVGRKIECLVPRLSHVRKTGSHITLRRLIAEGIQRIRYSLPLAHYELLELPHDHNVNCYWGMLHIFAYQNPSTNNTLISSGGQGLISTITVDVVCKSYIPIQQLVQPLEQWKKKVGGLAYWSICTCI